MTSRRCCCNCPLRITEVCFRVSCIEKYPTVEPECENAVSVRAIVTEVVHGSGVSVGDEIIVYDPRHVYFDRAIETIIGLTGTAVSRKMPTESDWGAITSGCPEYDLYGDCRWVVSDVGDCQDASRDEISFRILSNAPIVRTYDESVYGLRVWAEVIEVPCGVDSVDLWEKIIVWDLDSDKFNHPVPVLLGAIGTAKSITDPLSIGEVACSGNCRWVCQKLICTGEIHICNS